MAAGDISDALVVKIRIDIEDPSTNPQHADAEIFTALSDAQLEIAGLLHNEYLTEFEEIEANVTIVQDTVSRHGVANEAFSAFNTNTGVLKGKAGITRVIFYNGTSWAEATKLDEKSIKESENTYFTPADAQPGWYVFKNYLYMVALTFTASKANIYNLKPPTAISTSIDPVLNMMFHPLLRRMAEGRLWAAEDKLDRSAKTLGQAFEEIKVWNSRLEPPVKMGTKKLEG